MPWARFDDEFPDHPKVLAAGPLAAWLHVCAICYACRYLTDGFIPHGQVRRLADVEDPTLLVGRLVSSGLWEVVPGGYRVHDFLEYQPARAGVAHERELTKKRTAEWRERQESKRNGVRNAVRDAVGDAVTRGVTNSVSDGIRTGAPARPGPAPLTPDPDPAGSSPPLPPSPQAGKGEALQPATTDDIELWDRARDALTTGWLAANVEKAQAFEPIGRGPDGGLRLRAPPWAQHALSPHQARAALVAAGDAAGKHAQIVTGGG
jgi:hypothetical protein